MLQGLIAKKVIGLIIKKIMEKSAIKNMRKYVEEDNELDRKVRELEDKIIDLESKMNGRRLKKGEDNVIN